MNLLQFSQQTTGPGPGLPLTLIWPADMPIEAIPANHKRLSDGRLQVIYYTIDELKATIHVLSLVKEARELGGVVVSEAVQLEMIGD